MSNDGRKGVAKQIDECKYLYLRNLHEPRDNEIRFVVEEARLQTPLISTGNEVPGSVEALFHGAQPIRSDSSSRLFEISYYDYISYTVSNETYGKYPTPPELFTGSSFRIFSWSYLLDLTRKTTYASDDHPGPKPLEHHQIVCLNHVIDIITTHPPRMVLLDRMTVNDDFLVN